MILEYNIFSVALREYYILKILVQKILVWTICPKLFWSEFFLVQSFFESVPRVWHNSDHSPRHRPCLSNATNCPPRRLHPGQLPRVTKAQFRNVRILCNRPLMHRSRSGLAPAYAARRAGVRFTLTFSQSNYTDGILNFFYWILWCYVCW